MSERKQKFALFGNIYQARQSASIEKVLSTLSLFDADVSIDSEYYRFLHDVEHFDVSAANIFSGNDFEADFAVSMGGDGTFLKTASRVGSKQIPIVGVNMGRLGFLADVSPTDIETCLKALCAGSYSLEERAVIQVESDGMPLPDGGFALNDVAILKRDTASMISIRVHVDDIYLTTYQADGLIVSTPTGSTAYSLSNGGPIIVPGTKVMAMTAVAPHSLNVRPIVIPDASVVTLDVASRSHSFLIAVDGRSVKCQEGTRITLRRAPYNVRVVKRSAVPYFTTLREKLMWGADSRV